jgi:uncharacterized protein YigE (DUF2233 family)
MPLFACRIAHLIALTLRYPLLSLSALLVLGILPAPTTAAELHQYLYNQISITSCNVDMQRDHLRMYWKDPDGNLFGTFSRLRNWLRPQGNDLFCATNAGIYDKQYRPLGLYIEAGITLRKLNTRQNAYGNFYLQPNGVFIVSDDAAHIIDTTSVNAEPERWLAHARYATQSGPMLLRNGEINSAFAPDSLNIFVRNAVCIDDRHQVILNMARNPITFYDFARFLRDRLHCVDALYLDGNISRIYPSLEADLGPSFGAIIAVINQTEH